MATVLLPIPARDFDPTESAVPWRVLTRRGHVVRFATPDGRPGEADPRMVGGGGLGLWKRLLMADEHGRRAYAEMVASPEFAAPSRHDAPGIDDFDALVLPGGHAAGMRPYLESAPLKALVAEAFAAGKPVGAICHGVVLAARSLRPDGRSVLHGRRTTALTRALELSGWALTALWLGRYYRTYPTTVQDEVSAALADPADFIVGPFAWRRDSPERPGSGFTVRDGNYLSARWPGDAHAFALAFAGMLDERLR